MNLKSEPTKLNGFNFQIISEGGGVDLTWFGVHTYMTGKTLSRQVYSLRKRLHVKLCKPWGLLYKSDGDSRRKIKRETNMGLAQTETDHLSETKIYNLHP